MAGLKELRSRIAAIKSTKKIASAMKMIAASRLRRAKEVLAKNETYRHSVYKALQTALELMKEQKEDGIILPPICCPKEKKQRFLLVVLSSDKGLCGSYNSAIGRAAVNRIEELLAAKKEVKLITLGQKGFNLLRRNYGSLIIRNDCSVVNQGVDYVEALDLANEILNMFNKDEIDVCEIVYSGFKSALNRETLSRQVLPFDLDFLCVKEKTPSSYDMEPWGEELTETLVDMAFKEFIFDIMINSQASEQGARMSSMDNATRNAGEMISKLTLKYNRLRQSAITTELTEIIAGAEAV